MTGTRHASTTGGWRLVRGVAVGSCASGIGALAHVSAGGSTPSIPLLAALGLATTGVCVLMSRWRWTTASLTAALLLAQLGFHQAFAWHGALGTPHAAGLHGHHTAAAGDVMAAHHVLAAIALAVMLRFGEGWLRGVLDVLGTRLLRWFVAAWSPPTQPPATALCTVDLPVMHDPATSVWSRGPPR